MRARSHRTDLNISANQRNCNYSFLEDVCRLAYILRTPGALCGASRRKAEIAEMYV